MENEQSLRDFLTAEPESAGDTSPETPAVATEPPATETPDPEPPADTGDEPTGDEEPLWDRTILDQHPELQPLAKQLQADYTRKTQSLAEQRKAIEGLDPADLQWLKQFNEARTLNPALAQQMWEQATQQVMGQSAPPATPEDDPWVTDTERQLDQRQARTEQMLQELNLANIRMQVDQQWASLEAGEKTQIPHDQRLQVLSRMAQLSTPERPIPVTELPLFWRGMYGFDHARKVGRGEGERLGAQKAGLGAAPTAQVNVEPAEQPPAKNLRDHLIREVGDV